MNGDPLIFYYYDVIDVLIDLRTDEDTLIAGLFYGLVDIDKYDKDEVSNLFGEDVVFLIDSLSFLGKIKSNSLNVEVESIRRMFVSMAKDLRVIFLKFADRLVKIRQLDFYSSEQQKLIAKETLEVFVPIASRLGIYVVKSKFEDLSFKYLYPKQYAIRRMDMDEYLKSRRSSIEDIKREVKSFLSSHGIEAEVEGRIKNLYSIYRKLKVKNQTNLTDLYDVFAVRIILPDRYDENGKESVDHLYSILGLIYSRWKPVPNRFKDYVAVPKPNGYSSLHTAVLGLCSKFSQVTEIQIRTKRMHEEAEYGIASHWLYDSNKKNVQGRKVKFKDDEMSRKYMDWIAAVSDVQKNLKYGKNVIETFKLDIFSDRIFVMTPEGEIRDLPVGSTPVDFAYSLGEEIGHRCKIAKIDGSPVFLNYELQNGDMVEIITGLQDDPKISWLSFVKTTKARNAIKSFFKAFNQDKVFQDGLELINNALVKYGKDVLDDDLSLFKEYLGEHLSYKNRENLVKKVGDGSLLVDDVLKNVFGEDFIKGWKNAMLRKSLKNRSVVSYKNDKDEIYISGELGVPYRIAKCCLPKKGTDIVAYINKNNVITVHAENCKVLSKVDNDRVLEAKWKGVEDSLKKYSVKIEIVFKSRVGLIRDIADVIAGLGINILYLSDVGANDSYKKKNIVIEVFSEEQVLNVIEKLKKVRSVIMVSRGK